MGAHAQCSCLFEPHNAFSWTTVGVSKMLFCLTTETSVCRQDHKCLHLSRQWSSPCPRLTRRSRRALKAAARALGRFPERQGHAPAWSLACTLAGRLSCSPAGAPAAAAALASPPSAAESASASRPVRPLGPLHRPGRLNQQAPHLGSGGRKSESSLVSPAPAEPSSLLGRGCGSASPVSPPASVLTPVSSLVSVSSVP